MGDSRRRLAGAILSGSVLAALAFLVAGCGSGSGTAAGANSAAATTTTAASGSGRAAAFQAFSSCLKQHGVTQPGGGFFGRRPAGAGTGTATTPPQPPRRARTAAEQKAFQACRGKLPGGGSFGGRGGSSGRQNNPAFTRYTQCLKAHGVTFGQSANASTFQKAQGACAKYRPSFAPGAGGSSGASSTTTRNG